MYRIYGDSLLLERIVDSRGLRKDLVSVFGKDIADEMLTISYFLLETDKNLSRLEAEARVQWFPSSNGLSPERITRLSQSITKDQMDSFMKLRKERNSDGAKWLLSTARATLPVPAH